MFGPFDEMFDFNHDGEVDRREFIMGMDMLDDWEREEGIENGDLDDYDEGYEDVSLDDDYDTDRYNSDDDYAMGVDDALDELEDGEDW